MPNYMTHAGYEKIRSEIETLQKRLRGEIARKVGEAAAHGDLRENAEYDAAKQQQHLIARRLQELGELIQGAEIIENMDLPDGLVTVGKTVHLRNLDTNQLDIYTILGPIESDVDNNIISYETPLVRQLMLKKEGEEVEIHVPAGAIRYRIEKIERFQSQA
ncbi:MAG: transcription elongation factor GreA [Calditrichaeota bacterium]|nr:transcription elongation factor GreA [Calditrichota bacterium]